MEKPYVLKTLFKSPVSSDIHFNVGNDRTTIDEQEINVQSTSENSLLSGEDDYVPQSYTSEVSTIEAFASAIVLEEAIDELVILGHMGDLPNVEADLTYKSLRTRFAKDSANSYIFDPETIEPYEVALDKQKFIKFQQDRSCIEKILRETLDDLTQNNSYACLVKHLNIFDKQFYDENRLLDNEMKNKIKLHGLKALLETERREALSEIQACSETIGNLKDQLQDLICENKIKSTYIENWEDSRLEQNYMSLDKQEENYSNIINKGKMDIEKEVRVAAEIESFIIENQREYEEGIQFWMERYDKEIELRDTEIQVLKEKREEQFNCLRQISHLYDEHKLEIEQYLAVKEIRRQEALLLEMKNKAATKIQAWWRGLMVRKGFGQFRKTKGKKDKGSEKKKGKK